MSISISKRKINKINNFQYIIKYKLSIIRKINEELNLIYNFICSTMSNLNQHVNINKLKKKEKYNMYVEKIEKIFSDYNKIIYPVSIYYLNHIGKNNLYLIINEIFEQLFKVCEEIGAISCSNVISIFKNDDKEWKSNLSKNILDY